MKLDKEFSSAASMAPRSLRALARSDWRWWLPGAALCFLMASLAVGGWPDGLLPNLQTPLVYKGDGLSHAWMIKRVLEGWLFSNPHSGYPFGSDFYDYPGSDAGNLLVLKLIGLSGANWAAVLNLYFLAGYSACFASAFLVLRSTGLLKPFALAAAVLYSFLPFHLQRIPHLFFTWYFVAPLFFYFALRIADGKLFEGRLQQHKGAKLASAATLVALGCFGVYYALFGVLMFVAVAFAALSARHDRRAFKVAFAASCFVVLGVALNVAPTLVYQKLHGKNPEVAHRSAADAEVYGLKMMQLLVPHPTHRAEPLRNAAARYNAATPLVNENISASLALVGGAGFLAMLAVAFTTLAGRKQDHKLALVALLVTMLFLFGTIGGLGALFSHTIASSIRGWNRVSVFIGFGSLLGLFLLLQNWMQGRWRGRRLATLSAVAALLLGAAGLYDQTSAVCMPCNAQTAKTYQMDHQFVQAIEAALPPRSAVYQLPYMAFPEVPPLQQMDAYDLIIGYLHSSQLHWSYAGMKGRSGDMFYRALANEPLARQYAVLRKLGFGGIYIDKRGYADQGAAVIAGFTLLTGQPPLLSRADGQVVFFRVPGSPAVDLSGKSAQQIQALTGYDVERASALMAVLKQGIELGSPVLPPQLAGLGSFSGAEHWGRWTEGPLATINFAEPLRGRFTLAVRMRPYGPNAGQDLLLRVGSEERLLRLLPGEHEYKMDINLGDGTAGSIELRPPAPTSPRTMDRTPDDRLLGVGVSLLRFEF